MAQLIHSKMLDFIEKLPNDITKLISEYLSVHDINSCRRVSKLWKANWPVSWILAKPINRHFRVAFKNFVHDPLYNPKNLEAWVKTRILQQRNRQQGPYKWKEINHVVDEGKHIKYHGDREAFAVDEHTVNLVTHTGVLRVSFDDKVSKVFVSNDLLAVLTSGLALSEDVQTSLTLYVLYIEFSVYFVISVPSNYQLISLYNGQVAISMKRYRIMARVAEDMMLIDPFIRSPADKDIIFHPTSKNSFMTVSVLKIECPGSDLWIVVSQFTDGKHTNTCKFGLFIEDMYNIEESIKLDIRPIDENGLYSICWIDDRVLDDAHACLEYSERGAIFNHLLSYNVYEKTFMIKCFYGGIYNLDESSLSPPLGNRLDNSENCFVWADQMFTPYLDIESNSLFIQTVWSFKIPKSPVPYILENGAGVKSEKDDHDANGFRISLICKLEDVGADIGEEIRICGNDKYVRVLAGGRVFQMEEPRDV